MQIKTVAIIGSGQMGCGIAQSAALAGFDVLLNDISAERVENGISTISGNMARAVASGKVTEDARAAALPRIRPAPAMEDLAAADLVIEAATEDEATKRKIYASVCPVLKPEAILATNTSSISIASTASAGAASKCKPLEWTAAVCRIMVGSRRSLSRARSVRVAFGVKSSKAAATPI